MQILFLVGRELDYPRNDVLLRAFNRFAEVDIVGFRKRPKSLLFTNLVLAARAIPKLVFRGYDLVFVGFYGHLLMLPVGLLSRQPILFDAYLSTYDTLVLDRKTTHPSSLLGKTAAWLDRNACRLSSHILLDTRTHIQYFERTFSVPSNKFTSIPVGCNESLFTLQPPVNLNQSPRVLYYSSYLPLHGVETIVHAARLLKGESLQFRLIGMGRTFSNVRELSEEMKLTKVEFIQPIPITELPGEIREASICLGGHFGLTEKGERVIPTKVYQILASNRPLVAGDTPAVRELLTNGVDCILCAPGNAQELADAILRLARDVEFARNLAQRGRLTFERECSEAIITQTLHELILNMINSGKYIDHRPHRS